MIIPYLSGVLDVIYPKNCLNCDVHVADGFLCSLCNEKLHLVDGHCCNSCGHPFAGLVESTRSCQHCHDFHANYKKGYTLMLMNEVGRKFIHQLKYKNGFYLKKEIDRIIGRQSRILELVEDAILVPVPLHYLRQQSRGFNQSEFIAQCIKRVGERVEIQNILTRVKLTSSQTKHTRKDRKKNMKNAFALSKKACLDCSRKYIVIDDVFTTGATVNACCYELSKKGIDDLYVLTLGHG